MQFSPLPVAGHEQGETISPGRRGRARGGCPVPPGRSTLIAKAVTAALVSHAVILLLGYFTWQRASAPTLHHIPPWCLHRDTARAAKNGPYSANRGFLRAPEGGTWQKPSWCALCFLATPKRAAVLASSAWHSKPIDK